MPFTAVIHCTSPGPYPAAALCRYPQVIPRPSRQLKSPNHEVWLAIVIMAVILCECGKLNGKTGRINGEDLEIQLYRFGVEIKIRIRMRVFVIPAAAMFICEDEP